MKKQLRLKVYNALGEGSPDKEFNAKDESVLDNVPVQILTKLRFAEKKELQLISAYLDCAGAYEELSETAQMQLEVRKLEESNCFENLKKIV